MWLHYVNTKLDEIKGIYAFTLGVKESSIKSPNTQPAWKRPLLQLQVAKQCWPELSEEPKTPSTTYNIGYMYVYYICMYVYMYNIHMCIHLPKFSFSSTIVFDPAKVWNLISDFDL